MNNGLTRRDWLVAAACWSELLARGEDKRTLVTLTPAEAAEIEAIAGEIIPEDDGTPGAKTAGVIWFIDRALREYDEDKRHLYTTGLQEAQRRRAEMFPGSSSLAGLDREQRIALLRSLETTEFFRQVRLHTVLGFLGHPKYGGNRDQVGWKHIGFEPKMHHSRPFGAYDAEENRG